MDEADFRPLLGLDDIHKQGVEHSELLGGWAARLLSKQVTKVRQLPYHHDFKISLAHPRATAIPQKDYRQTLLSSGSTHAPCHELKRNTESAGCSVLLLICMLSLIMSFVAANCVLSIYNKTGYRHLAVVSMPTDDINTQHGEHLAP